jgi:signal transduction histidine kinase
MTVMGNAADPDADGDAVRTEHGSGPMSAPATPPTASVHGAAALGWTTSLPLPFRGIARRASVRLGRLSRSASRASGSATLRRVPILTAVAVAIISAPIFSALTNRVVDARADNRWQGVVNSAQERTLRAQAQLGGGERVDDGLVFVVKPNTRETQALGATDLEPPLFRLAKEAEGGPAQSWFLQSGRAFNTFTRRYDAETFLVTIEDTSWLEQENRSDRSAARRWSLATWALLAGLTGILTHRLLRPARRVLRERIDFLADAAHELRTPLSVIQASAGHALARERDPVDYVQSLVEIRSAAERAGAGVSELLDLARFDAGQAVPRLAPLRLDLLAEELVSATRLDDCDLSAETGPTVLVHADMALLRQALDNLIRNAASRSGQVVIRCRVDATDGVIEITDDGPGFNAEQLPYVFERYRRGDGRGSLGLGLPIAASIVAAHGGRVDIASPAPQPLSDKPGSVVTVRLPLSRS